MFQATHDVGTCTFCGGGATPAFVNGSTDVYQRFQRFCAACLAETVGLIGFVLADEVEPAREALKQANADRARLSSELDVERHRATELEAELTQVRQRYDELEYRSGGVQSALVEAKRYAAELERDSVPLAALQKAFAEAVDRVNGKPKTTTKKETANV